MTGKLYKEKINLGRKISHGIERVSKPKEITYPSMYISNIKLPLEGEDVGKKFRCMIDVELSGVNKRVSKNDSSLNYDFDIKTIQFIDSK